MLKPYNKKPLLFSQQVQQLIDRGMTIANTQQAERVLSRVNYYRLSAYWHPFRERDAFGKVTDRFLINTSFDEVLSFYEFDRKLRLLVLDAIERVEVCIRTQVAYYMAHTYGAFGHTNAANFHSGFNHAKWLQKIEEESWRSNDQFIEHYKVNYLGFPQLPVWIVTEVMSIGGLSFLYEGMQNSDKTVVAAHYQIHYKELQRWLHNLSYVRNVCAHHSRLWNRDMAIKPRHSKDPLWSPPITPSHKRLFYVLLMLRHLLKVSSGNGNDWANAIEHLISPIASNRQWQIAMGLPNNWQKHPLWV